jgi:hypothetical protein
MYFDYRRSWVTLLAVAVVVFCVVTLVLRAL